MAWQEMLSMSQRRRGHMTSTLIQAKPGPTLGQPLAAVPVSAVISKIWDTTALGSAAAAAG